MASVITVAMVMAMVMVMSLVMAIGDRRSSWLVSWLAVLGRRSSLVARFDARSLDAGVLYNAGGEHKQTFLAISGSSVAIPQPPQRPVNSARCTGRSGTFGDLTFLHLRHWQWRPWAATLNCDRAAMWT